MFQHNVWNTCIWMYLVLSNTMNEIYLTYPTCQPHIINMLSPRLPTRPHGNSEADVDWLPPSCSFQSLQSSVPKKALLIPWIEFAGVGSGFIQGTSPIPDAPWCWNIYQHLPEQNHPIL
jgi:hypothetical protein